MTRLDEFKEMLKKIDEADSWDAYPEYWNKLCYWYDIDETDTEKYHDPEDVFNAIKEAIAKEEPYIVIVVGGEQDGKEVGRFDDEAKAINFARKYEAEHEEELDPVCGGVAIINNTTGNALTDW